VSRSGLLRRWLWHAGVLSGSASLVLALGAGTPSDAATATPVGTGAHPAVLDGTWGNAEELPGSATLNTGGEADVNQVACASADDCTAGGAYTDSNGDTQAFVADESDGTWGNAQEVPGTATLNAGGSAVVYAVDCASAGNCSAGGSYTDSNGDFQVFVANETDGTWGTAEEIPGSAALNTGGVAIVNSVSCASAGYCTIAGDYSGGIGDDQAFVANEKDGTWANAEEVPGTAALNAGGAAYADSVSCSAAGNCGVDGSYTDSNGDVQAFVVNEQDGIWGTAEEIPGTAALNAGGNAQADSVSCTSAGNCGAGGWYSSAKGKLQAFVVDDVDGTWDTAEEVPGTATLNVGADAAVNSVSCNAAGDCSAGGYYYSKKSSSEAFVVDEKSGTWGSAQEVAASINTGGGAFVSSLSCGTEGNCSAGGTYQVTSTGAELPFVISETSGTWGTAEEVPGISTLDTSGSSAINSVSCGAAGNCGGGGYYSVSDNHEQAYVVNES
jgi:hypothetical protein